MAQKDGGLPALCAAGVAPGESGVSVLGLKFDRGVHFNAVPRQHLVWFQLSDVHMACRRAGRVILEAAAPAGSMAICPAGLDCGGDAEQGAAAILVSIQPRHLALAAVEKSSIEAVLMDRTLSDDRTLFELGRILALESAGNYPNGPLYWHGAASSFIDRLVTRHSVECDGGRRRFLGKDVLRRLRDYVMAHLEEAIDVPALANIAGRSPSHFSQAFTRCVGLSPHRYVVHLRLQRAVELVRDGRSSLADIAACTGFADQSHLSRWIRRVYGVSLTTLTACRPKS
jgi:AraC family transcriptional regulator